MTLHRENYLDVVEVVELDSVTTPEQVTVGGSRSTTRNRTKWRTAYVVAAVAAAAALLGFGAGRSGRPEPTASNPALRLPIVSIAPNGVISETGRRCAVWVGRELQLGVEVENLGPAAVELLQLDVLDPSPDVRPISVGVATCGQLGPAEPVAGTPLSTLGTTWLSTALLATTACPAASAVDFRVTYMQAGQSAATSYRALADIGGVPYPGCPQVK